MEKLKILIVEDESLIALALKHSLIRAGYEVCELVASGEQAIESAKKESPDVILMDTRLRGGMDGIEAARQIGNFSSATIIFTTGYQYPSLKGRAMALNPAAYLVKPVEIYEIEQAIHSARKTQD